MCAPLSFSSCSFPSLASLEMGLLFSRDALPHNTSMMWLSVVGFQPPGAPPCPHSGGPGEHLALPWSWPRLPDEQRKKLCIQLTRTHHQPCRPAGWHRARPAPRPSPEGSGARLEADSSSRLPAKAGPAGNQLPAPRSAVRAGAASGGRAGTGRDRARVAGQGAAGAAGITRPALELADTVTVPPLSLYQEGGRMYAVSAEEAGGNSAQGCSRGRTQGLPASVSTVRRRGPLPWGLDTPVAPGQPHGLLGRLASHPPGLVEP